MRCPAAAGEPTQISLHATPAVKAQQAARVRAIRVLHLADVLRGDLQQPRVRDKAHPERVIGNKLVAKAFGAQLWVLLLRAVPHRFAWPLPRISRGRSGAGVLRRTAVVL